VLALLASALIVAFGGITHHLIPLYSVGVFLSFTLSQAGMVRRWARLRTRGWRQSALINGIGAVATAAVLLVISITKFASGDPISLPLLTTPVGYWLVLTAVAFVLVSMHHRWMGKWLLGLSIVGFLGWWAVTQAEITADVPVHMGAWVVVVVIPMLIWMCSRIRAHYREVADHLTMERYRPAPRFKNTILVMVAGLHRGIMPALEYARSLGSDIRAVYVELQPEKTPELMERWRRYAPDIPLVMLASPYRALTQPIVRYVDEVEREQDDDIVTVIIPEFVPEKWWTVLLHGQAGLMLKWALLFKKGVVVTNLRYYLGDAPDDELGDHPLISAQKQPAGHPMPCGGE